VWDLGEWDVADWGEAVPERTLGQDLVEAIHLPEGSRTPEGRDLAALLEALARHPLLVAPWVAVPEVRQKVSELQHTAEGVLVRERGFPILCRYALRLAWDEVRPRPEMDVHVVAHELHTRAMVHMVYFLDEIAGDEAASAAAVIRAIPRSRLESMLVGCLTNLEQHLGPGQRRRLAAMLACTPNALRARKYRLKRRLRSKRHAPPGADPSKIA
jgi:hypothetical protein